MSDILHNISLKPFNTFAIDVSCDYFLEISSTRQLADYFRHEHRKNIPFLILSQGSNVLFTRHFEGIVLHPTMPSISIIKEEDKYVWVEVEAGVVWDDWVQYCVNNGWSGVENLSLIPGLVGAAPVQNIGAYGSEVRDTITEIRFFDTQTLSFGKHSNYDAKFSYRQSLYKKEKGRYFITSVVFRLDKMPKHNLSYTVLHEKVKNMDEVSLQTIRKAVVEIRRSKLPDPAEMPNGGSFFKNPVVEKAVFTHVAKQYPDVPHYPQSDGMVKIPAGWLIEKAGWKGKRLGNVGVHEKQALVLVNWNNASGQEVYDFSETLLQDINRKFGVGLEREINIIA